MTKAPRNPTRSVTIRMDADLRRRMEDAAAFGPYTLSMTNIVERGVELALQELEELRAKSGGTA